MIVKIPQEAKATTNTAAAIPRARVSRDSAEDPSLLAVRFGSPPRGGLRRSRIAPAAIRRDARTAQRVANSNVPREVLTALSAIHACVWLTGCTATVLLFAGLEGLRLNEPATAGRATMRREPWTSQIIAPTEMRTAPQRTERLVPVRCMPRWSPFAPGPFEERPVAYRDVPNKH
jgi:hypothetical protein